MVQLNIIGPPGGGKGTAAQLIKKKFGLKHLSSGDLLREEIKKGSKLGKKAEAVMKSGRLVDDAIISRLVEDEIRRLKGNFILDGYPRTIEQAKSLERALKRINKKMDGVLLLETSEETIIKRLSSRKHCKKCNQIYGKNFPPKIEGICDNCGDTLFQREDDKPEVIKKRFALYREQMSPVIEFYSRRGLVAKIRGAEEPDQIISILAEKGAKLVESTN